MKILVVDPQRLPSLVTDDAILIQILQKLIDNPIKFTERGAVTVSARVNGHYEFGVSDTGIGILGREPPVVFDKQVDSSSTASSAAPDWGFTL